MGAKADPNIPADLKAHYVVLQQEADFGLWKAREGGAEIKKMYAAHLAGEGPAPTPQELADLAALEHDTESKYRALRAFLREYFGADEK